MNPKPLYIADTARSQNASRRLALEKTNEWNQVRRGSGIGAVSVEIFAREGDEVLIQQDAPLILASAG